MERYLEPRRVMLALAGGKVLLVTAAANAAQPPGKLASFCGNGTAMTTTTAQR